MNPYQWALINGKIKPKTPPRLTDIYCDCGCGQKLNSHELVLGGKKVSCLRLEKQNLQRILNGTDKEQETKS